VVTRIIDFCARNRLIVLILVAVAAIYGWWAMKHVALDAIPDLSDTKVIVYSRWDRSPDLAYKRRPPGSAGEAAEV
jgi:copper/silver efflux system protein